MFDIDPYELLNDFRAKRNARTNGEDGPNKKPSKFTLKNIFIGIVVLLILYNVYTNSPEVNKTKEDLQNVLNGQVESTIPDSHLAPSGGETVDLFEGLETSETTVATPTTRPTSINTFTYEPVPWDGTSAYVEVNNNIPYFTPDEIFVSDLESYTELDELDRCGVAYICAGNESAPTEERGSISSVYPSGWNQEIYDCVPDGGYLYNRCHLLAFMISGENANPLNLITGTRFLNIDGMLGFETEVDNYIENTGNHVLYRVTPIYDGDNLVASGVLMEAYSIEDNGEGVQFCVYAYNVQPGVIIHYEDGTSELA